MSGIAAAILIGGHSKRMGRPKENIVIKGDGRTFMEKLCDEVDGCYGLCIDGRYISVRKGQQVCREGYRTVEDIYDDIGPLGGLISVLTQAKEDGYNAVLLLACDMIGYDGNEIKKICGLYKGDGILYAHTGGGNVQPLASIYGTDVLDAALKNAKKGDYRLRDVADDKCTVEIYESDHPEAYINCNEGYPE